MKKALLYTKYKLSKQELKILTQDYCLSLEQIESYIDNLSFREREIFFYKIQKKLIELADKKV